MKPIRWDDLSVSQKQQIARAAMIEADPDAQREVCSQWKDISAPVRDRLYEVRWRSVLRFSRRERMKMQGVQS